MTLAEDHGFADNGNAGDFATIEEMDSLPPLLEGHSLGDERVLLTVPPHMYPYVRALAGPQSGSTGNVGLVVYPAVSDHSIFDYEQRRWRFRTFSWRYKKIKRLTDLIIAGTNFIIAVPLMGLIAALIELDSPGPIFFSQARVGPPLPHEVRNYKLLHFECLDASPGITGLWQVVRGDKIDFDEMVRLDIEYMDGWSLQKDIKILLRTVPAMMRGEGAY